MKGRALLKIAFLDYMKSVLKSTTFTILIIAVFTRIMLVLVGCIYIAVFKSPGQGTLYINHEHLDMVINSLRQADVGWYLGIVENGYEQRPFSLEKQANWAFFPLWPFIMSSGKFFSIDPFYWGLIAGNLFFLMSLAVLYKLLLIDCRKEVAFWAVIFFILFPFPQYLMRPGPEPMFLFLTFLAFYLAKKRKWTTAGLCTALTALTRLQGVFTIVPLFYLYIQQSRQGEKHHPGVWTLLLSPLAVLSFMGYIYELTGNLCAIFEIQKTWGNVPSFPFHPHLRFILRPYIYSSDNWDFGLINFVFALAAVFLAYFMLRERKKFAIPGEYIIFTIIHLFIIVSRKTFMGTVRYVMAVFPLYLILAHLVYNKRLLLLMIIVIQVLLMTFFFICMLQHCNWAVV